MGVHPRMALVEAFLRALDMFRLPGLGLQIY